MVASMLVTVTLALRNVLRNRRRSAVTFVAIAMAVAILVFVRGTLNGLQALLIERVVYGQTGVVQIHRRGFVDNVKRSPLQFAFALDDALLGKVRAVSDVLGVTPRIVFPTMVNIRDITLFSIAQGIDPDSEYQVCPQKRRDLGEGAVRSEGDQGFAVVTPELVTQLGLRLGEELTLLAPDFDGTLNGALVKVGGFLADNPAFSGDRKLIFVPIATAQALLRLEGRATELAVRSAHPGAAADLKARMEMQLGPEFEVHTWRELAKFAVDALNNQEAALAFVTVVFTLVALFGILNTMLMIVLSRTKEIGTMMAVGMRRRGILRLIVGEAALLGGLGAIFGGALGMVVVYALGKVGLPMRPTGATIPDVVRPVVSVGFVLQAVVVAIVGAAVAALYPAYRASRMTPVQALSAL